jgi:tetratricopeptide (TPR) repeat protein
VVSTATTDEQRHQARDLVSTADQAAILGDTAAALASLRRARSLDPADADLAFRLARLYETGAAPDSAVKEYCRFLAISPASPDAADARERLTALARPASDPVVDSANSRFEQGLRAYDAGRMLESEAHFARAIEAQPAWADAYFDRALVRVARDERDDAASDYEIYMRLRPNATDRAYVASQIAALRGTRLSSGQAFGLGLVIPGAGQFYTRRPVLGSLYLVGTAAAIGFAMQQQTTIRTTQQTATDPFGNPYTYTSTLQAKTRRHLGAGLAAAAAIDLVGAIEAAVYASRERGAPPPARVSVQLLPAQTALAMRVVF